jgi:hypothetical protein
MVIFRKIQNRRGRFSLLLGLFLLLALASFSRTTWAMRQLPTLRTVAIAPNSPAGFEPAELNFTWKAGDPKPAPQTVLVTGLTEGYSFGADQGWLTYSEPKDVGNNAEFTISVDPTGFTTPGVKEAEFGLTQEPSQVKFTLKVKLTVESVPSPLFEPASLNFVWEKGGPNPPAQTVLARNVGGVSYSSEPGWLRIPAAKYVTGGFQLSIQVNPGAANLDVGVHEGTASLTTDGKTITLPVKLTVVSADGKLQVNRKRLTFGGFFGSPLNSQIVGITFTGLNSVNWSAAGPPWLTLTPANGAVSATAPITMSVGINTAAISQAGKYTGTLTVTDQTTTHEIAVELFQVPPGSPTIQLFGLEVTQAIQNLINDIPFIANRPAFVRGHVRSLSGQPIEKVTAQLIGTRNGAELGRLNPINPGGSIRVVADPDRGQLNDSFLFELPPSWRTGTVTLRLAGQSQPISCVDPAEKSAANGAANDCTVTLTYQTIPVMPITYVLANDKAFVDGPNGKSGPFDFTPNASHAAGTSRQLMAGMPLSGIDEQVYPTSVTFPGVREADDNGKVLDQTSDLHKKAGEPRRHFYAIFARYELDTDPNTWSQGGPGGVAVYPGFVGQGEFNANNPDVGSLNVHEIAHNLNRDHVACGLPKGEIGDTQYPHPNQQISTVLTGNESYYGFNINTKTIYPPTYKDVMSYCWPNWISPYNYKAMMERLKTHYNPPAAVNAAGSDAAQVIAVANSPIMLVSGRITSTVAGTIDDVEDSTATGDIITATNESDFSLRLEDSAGQTLATYPVTPKVVDRHGQARYTIYNLVAPRPANLTRIVLLHDEDELAERVASSTAPTITLLSPVGEEVIESGPLTITWTASDTNESAVAAALSSELTYNIDYSTDDGATWRELALDWPDTTLILDSTDLPGSPTARVRVSANDGFLTTFAESYTFSVTNKLPVAVILTDDLSRYYVGGQSILLEGAGYDLEDGEVNDLNWYSDRDGLLGSGPSLLLNADELAEGSHIIYLEAIDSNGQSSFDNLAAEAPGEEAVEEEQDSVTFDIFYDPLSLPAELAVGPNLGFFTVEGANEILTDTLDVSNLGDGALGWSAASDAANVTLSSTSGDAPTTVVVSVDTTGLTYGLYQGTLTFTPTEPSLAPVLVDYFINVEVAPAAPITYTLTITKAGNGIGTVTSSPAGINCGNSCSAAFTASTVITLTATPAANNSFGGWSGGCTGNSATCQVTMDATKAVTATFTATPVSNGGSRVYMPLVQR